MIQKCVIPARNSRELYNKNAQRYSMNIQKTKRTHTNTHTLKIEIEKERYEMLTIYNNRKRI